MHVYALLGFPAIVRQPACSAGMPICPVKARPDTFGRALPWPSSASPRAGWSNTERELVPDTNSYATPCSLQRKRCCGMAQELNRDLASPKRHCVRVIGAPALEHVSHISHGSWIDHLLVANVCSVLDKQAQRGARPWLAGCPSALQPGGQAGRQGPFAAGRPRPGTLRPAGPDRALLIPVVLFGERERYASSRHARVFKPACGAAAL